MDSQDVRFYLSIFLRRLHYFVPVALIVILAGCLVAFALPPAYLAVAKIMVESPRIQIDLARPSVPPDGIRQLQILEQQLTTRASLLAMAERFAIYPDADISADVVVADMRARTRVEPVAFNNFGGGGSAIAFAISFEAGDPVLAAEVANAYSAAILESNERERKARAAAALEFFKRDVDRLEAALNDAQNAILRFKQEHEDALPDSLEFRRMQQRTGEERLQQLQREEVSLQQRRSTIELILATPAAGGAPTADGQMLADLHRALTEQQAIFNDDSPSLRMLRSRIADIEKRLSQGQAGPKDILRRNDLSPELRVQFADVEGQLAFVAEEEKSVGRALTSVAASIASTEMNSTILSTLERNYDTTQAQQKEAVARLAEAATGQRIEAEAIGEKLTLIEPATPPENPVRPKRHAIVAGSLAAGIGCGLGLVLLVEFWTKSIRRPADLASVFDGEPFATVPYISNGREVTTRRMGIAFLVLALLVSVPGVLFARKHLPPPIGTAQSSISNDVRTAPSM